MKIVFYLDFANMKSGGIYPYAKGVLGSLLACKDIETLYLIHIDSQIPEDLKALLSSDKIVLVPFNKHNKISKIRFLLSHFLMNTYHIYRKDFEAVSLGFSTERIKEIAIRLNPLRKIINALDADVVHIPFQVSPVYGINKPLVLTVHDVQELYFPQFFSSEERMKRSIYVKIAVEESDQIVVWFDHVKQDVERFFNKDKSAVAVAMPNVLNDWYLGIDANKWESIEEKYALHENYLFYPSATWQHKNHIKLLEALAILLEKGLDIYLYCTGHCTEFFPEIEQKMRDLNLENRVKFLGIVPIADLLALYKNAKLLVLPSLYEGGGIPVFEAMRMEVPLVCSNIYAYRQSVSNIDLMFDPLSAQSIADIILKFCEDGEFKKMNLKNSKDRLSYFDQIKFSDNFIKAYNNAIKNKEVKRIRM